MQLTQQNTLTELGQAQQDRDVLRTAQPDRSAKVSLLAEVAACKALSDQHFHECRQLQQEERHGAARQADILSRALVRAFLAENIDFVIIFGGEVLPMHI